MVKRKHSPLENRNLYLDKAGVGIPPAMNSSWFIRIFGSGSIFGVQYLERQP